MFFIPASDLATDTLIDRCYTAFDLHAPRAAESNIRNLVIQSISASGEPNLLHPQRLSDEALTVIGEDRFAASVGRVAATASGGPNYGVDINHAMPAEIRATTGLPEAIAEDIVRNRRAEGPFTSISDLDARVKGIGPTRARQLQGRVNFAWRPFGHLTTASWQVQLRLIGGGGSSEADLELALDAVATGASEVPHPSSWRHLGRPPASRALAIASAQRTKLILNDQYVGELVRHIGKADSRVLVCMFHIALGGDASGSRTLLEALRAAHERQADVRVLLDRDRRQDPYRSTVINARAREFLSEAGVPVRSDLEGKLLHSKYVVLDSRLAALGSHNWSAGSFAEMDDCTILIDSTQIAEALEVRFEAVWATAS